jgi:hypothetical protein
VTTPMAATVSRDGPGAPSLPSGRRLWRSWFLWATLGEAVGFCVPAAAAALTTSRPAVVSLPSLLLAGAVEGALLGTAQAHVLRRALPAVSSRRWVR